MLQPLNIQLLLASKQVTKQYETKEGEAKRTHGEDSKECRGAALDLATSLQHLALLCKQEVRLRSTVSELK